MLYMPWIFDKSRPERSDFDHTIKWIDQLRLIKGGKIIMFNVAVDPGKCVLCEECISNCPNGVFEGRESSSYPVNSDSCDNCGVCVSDCPSDAIIVVEN